MNKSLCVYLKENKLAAILLLEAQVLEIYNVGKISIEHILSK